MKNIKKILLLALFILALIPSKVLADGKKEFVIDFSKISSDGDFPSEGYYFSLLNNEGIIEDRGLPHDPNDPNGAYIIGDNQDFLLSPNGKKLVLVDISEEARDYYDQAGGYYTVFPLHQADNVTEEDNISFTITDAIVEQYTSDSNNAIGHWLEDFYEEYDKITIKFGPSQEQKDVVLKMYDSSEKNTRLMNYIHEQTGFSILQDKLERNDTDQTLTNKDGKVLYNYQTNSVGDDVTEEDNIIYTLTEEDLTNPRFVGKKRIIIQFVEAEIPPAEEEATEEPTDTNNIDGNPYTHNNLLYVLLGMGCTIGVVGLLSKKKSNN